MCECYQVGGRFIAEDPDCPIHGSPYPMYIHLDEYRALQRENETLRKAARLIHERSGMVSGSYEMGECDAVCKSVGLNVWQWPIVKGKK